MAVPDFQSFFLPLLELMSDGVERRLGDAVASIAQRMALTEEDLKQQLPSGATTTVRNRVGWARTYFVKAKLFEVVRRGVFKITERGRTVLAGKPTSLNVAYLRQFPEFKQFVDGAAGSGGEDSSKSGPLGASSGATSAVTPQEGLEASYSALRRATEADLLGEVRKSAPEFFENVVVDLLLAMGYGGSRVAAGKAIGGSGDEGIDGVIDQDVLGLEKVYVQAKRWAAQVGRPEIQKFAGALQGQQARKGVFITTSGFTEEARAFAAKINSRIVLVDGDGLGRLMYDYGIGVSSTRVYDVKRVDADYFDAGEV